jgi:hypothetical protein
MDSSPKEWDPSPIHAGQMRENSDVLPKGEPLGERREPKLKLLRPALTSAGVLSVFAHPPA